MQSDKDFLKKMLLKRKNYTFIIPVGVTYSGKSSLLATFLYTISSDANNQLSPDLKDAVSQQVTGNYIQNLDAFDDLPKEVETEFNSYQNIFLDLVSYNFKVAFLDLAGVQYTNLFSGGSYDGENELSLWLISRLKEQQSRVYFWLTADYERSAKQQDSNFCKFNAELVKESSKHQPLNIAGIFFFATKWQGKCDPRTFQQYITRHYPQTFYNLKTLKSMGKNVMCFPYSVGKVKGRHVIEHDKSFANNLSTYFQQTVLPV